MAKYDAGCPEHCSAPAAEKCKWVMELRVLLPNDDIPLTAGVPMPAMCPECHAIIPVRCRTHPDAQPEGIFNNTEKVVECWKCHYSDNAGEFTKNLIWAPLRNN